MLILLHKKSGGSVVIGLMQFVSATEITSPTAPKKVLHTEVILTHNVRYSVTETPAQIHALMHKAFD